MATGLDVSGRPGGHVCPYRGDQRMKADLDEIHPGERDDHVPGQYDTGTEEAVQEIHQGYVPQRATLGFGSLAARDRHRCSSIAKE
jgi:hypothetical protein